ncbi:MAG: transporter permease [Ilumatobacteraceae bacterium]|nr:transporter permease [Ilumatobacteraceae bacterium]
MMPTAVMIDRRVVVDSRVMIGRSLRHSARNTEALLTSIMLPVMLMLLFVYVFGGALGTGRPYVDFVVPGIIVLCAGFGAANTSVAVATDMTNGFVRRLRAMPMDSSAVLVGHVVASVARNCIATAIVVGVAFAVGWRPSATPVEWLAAVALVLLFVVAISWASAAVGVAVRTVDAANGFTFLLMFLPYLSSAFVPTNTMPHVLDAFARRQAVTPIIDTLRGLWMGTTIGNQAWWALGWCTAILVLSVASARRLFAHRTT